MFSAVPGITKIGITKIGRSSFGGSAIICCGSTAFGGIPDQLVIVELLILRSSAPENKRQNESKC